MNSEEYLKLQGAMHIVNENINKIESNMNYHLKVVLDRLVKLESQDGRITKDIQSNSELYSTLRIDLTNKTHDLSELSKKIKNIENFFGDHNFEMMINELNALDEEYKQKSLDIIAKLASAKKKTGIPSIKIDDLELSARVINVLRAKGIKSLEDIMKYSAYDYKNMNNLGIRSIRELNNVLGAHNLKLRNIDKVLRE